MEVGAILLHQVASLKVTFIRHQDDMEKVRWRTHQYFIDLESRIDVKLFALNKCHPFHVENLRNIDKLSTWSFDGK